MDNQVYESAQERLWLAEPRQPAVWYAEGLGPSATQQTTEVVPVEPILASEMPDETPTLY